MQSQSPPLSARETPAATAPGRPITVEAPAEHNALNSPERLASLRRLGLMDSPAEPAFDRLTRLAQQFLNAPIALVSFIDDRRQFFKATAGLSEVLAVKRELPLSHSFCHHTVTSGRPILIVDVRTHFPRTGFAAAIEPTWLAYLGFPIRSPDGFVLGTFCVIDRKARQWQDPEVDLMGELAHLAMAEVAARHERVGAEAALQASQEQLHKVLGWADCLVWEARVDCTAANWDWQFNIHPSGLFHRLFGERLPPSNVGLWYRFELPDQAEMDRRSRDAMLSGKTGYDQEFRVVKEGRTFWLRETVTIARPAPGKFWLVAVATDITRLHLAEHAVRTSQERLSRIFATMAEGIVLQDCTGAILECNEAAEKILGVTADQMKGRTSEDPRWQAVHADGSPFPGDTHPAFITLRTGEACRDIVMGVPKPDGTLTWISINSQAVIDPSGQVQGVVCTFIDITQQKAATDAVRLNAERLRLAADVAQVGVWEWNVTTGALVWNRQMFSIYGLPSDPSTELSYATWASQVLPEDLLEQEQFLGELIKTPGRTSEREFRIRRASDDSIRVIQAAEVAVRNEGESVTRVVGVNFDITERRQLVEQLQLARDSALDASRLKSEFLATMSHEIRTPMNGIIGMANLLMETSLEPAQRRMGTVIQNSAGSLLTIIDDILDFSKIEAGKLRVDAAPFDVRKMMSETLALLDVRARQKGIPLSCTIAEQVPSRLIGDADRIRQIVTNLVGNAVKFTTTGRVDVAVSACDRDTSSALVRFTVRDTGPGIPPATQARLFEPFTQGDATDARSFGGTGLGLAISRQLAELMGGTIAFRSTPGQGAEFWCDLRLALAIDAPAPPAPAHDLASPEVRAGKAGAGMHLHVLVADDNRANQLVAEMLLANMGCTVVIAENGEAALTRLARERFDVVLMDCQMPVLDGYATTRRIRSGQVPGVDPQLPVIAVTAYAMAGDEHRCREAGMNDYVTKPIRAAAVQQALQRCGFATTTRDVPAGSPAPQVDAMEPAVSLLDPEIIEECRKLKTAAGENLLEVIAAAFLRDDAVRLPCLEALINARDAAGVAKLAHLMAGSYANLGANGGRALLLELEALVRQPDWPRATARLAEIRPVLLQVHREVERWCAAR